MNIYVGNLTPEATEEELRQEFVAFGEVKSVTIMNDKYINSGQARGYGFVEMPLQSQGEAAIAALNGKILGRRAIDVIQALPLSNNGGRGSHSHRKGVVCQGCRAEKKLSPIRACSLEIHNNQPDYSNRAES